MVVENVCGVYIQLMEEFPRTLDLAREAGTRSLFLFGPRQTGKTYLLNRQFPNSPVYNLLKADEFLRISQSPQVVREELSAAGDSLRGVPVIIDEIQKMPLLLDEVHYMIESLGLTFVLTGSSPRKIVRGGANLLGGRARTRHLFPLVSGEIPGFDLVRACNVGTIPSVYGSDDPVEDLKAYCGNYLQQEIQAEGLVRRIDQFSRFLEIAALVSGELISMDSLSNDAGIAAATLREYFRILEDTLIGSMLKPLGRPVHRKAISTAKFYLFDVGVCNILAHRGRVEPKSELFGKTFEHFIYNELRAYLSYRRDDRPLSFWRDRGGNEVDFIIGDNVAIEVKATTMASDKHAKGLKRLGEEVPFQHKIIVSCDPKPRSFDTVLVLPYQEFLARLWGGAYRA